ncbi:Chaperone protein ClpB [Pseudovibrio axinellae]|uniref:Chaperone protein ClpB n=1 Tax=Pseudovibrio axinellae TaxID=989403 RepID=A0A165SYF9_9HYPH|nr:type VI secretion system ATPase TssH [Pseudovibrio axinellae]KZL05020.1 Chaperone protein ClpB [Pseudovibrio axinellae]SER65025.1 type VI secretion system protein VasG [Pseudovibrio axinellae]
MARLEIKALIERLNPCCRQAIEEAASLCVSNSHQEVTVEHFLISLVSQPAIDIRLLLQSQNVDPDDLNERLHATFNRYRRVNSDRTPTFSPMLQDLLQDAWLVASVEQGDKTIRSGALLIALLNEAGRYMQMDYYSLLQQVSPDLLSRNFAELTAGSFENDHSGQDANSPAREGADGFLQKYGTNFTQLAREGKVDPIFCRDNEIRQIIEILCRRRKNNPICVGEAGVGKTALAEGLALRIAKGDVPEHFKDVALWGLDIGALQAGASMKGEFEKRLKGVIDEVRSSPEPIILFIDEAHTLIGAGGDQGGSDAANLLKPALARGELKTIAATTWSEYKKYFEKDPALTRRFQLVKLDEPSIDEAIIIMRGLKQAYEDAHDVYITEEAINASVRLSARYITGRQLPDKAIDVLDTACARVRSGANTSPVELQDIEQRIQTLNWEQEGLKRDQYTGPLEPEQLEQIASIADQLVELEETRAELSQKHTTQVTLAGEFISVRNELFKQSPETIGQDELQEAQACLTRQRAALSEEAGDHPLVSVEVGPTEIAAIIGDWTGIPINSMVQDDYHRLLTLADTMKQSIKGQDFALEAIESRLRASRLDLHKKGQPLGTFLLAGPSGVGKTETALEVSRRLFGGEEFVTTINMSEYQERHTVSRLIGSPPGYVGYGEGGILTEAIRKKPYSVVLLDEVEKADPNVLNLFYQAFDKGELADGEGRLIDCRNIVFFLTSNLGSDQIENWVATAEEGKIPSHTSMLNSLTPLFAQHFKPALLARMEPLVYMPLSEDVLAQIVKMRLDGLVSLLQDTQKVALTISDAAYSRVTQMCRVASNGARLVDQVIQRQLLPTLSIELLEAGHSGEHIEAITIDCPEEAEGFSFAALYAEQKKSVTDEVMLEAV